MTSTLPLPQQPARFFAQTQGQRSKQINFYSRLFNQTLPVTTEYSYTSQTETYLFSQSSEKKKFRDLQISESFDAKCIPFAPSLNNSSGDERDPEFKAFIFPHIQFMQEVPFAQLSIKVKMDKKALRKTFSTEAPKVILRQTIKISNSPIWQLCYNREKNQLATGDRSGQIAVFLISKTAVKHFNKQHNVAVLQSPPICLIYQHIGDILTLDFQNNLLLSGSYDGYVKILDLTTQKTVLQVCLKAPVLSAKFSLISPNQIIVLTSDRKVRVIMKGQPTRCLELSESCKELALYNNFLFCSGISGIIHMRKLPELQSLGSFANQSKSGARSSPQEIFSTQVVKNALFVAGVGERVRVFDCMQGNQTFKFKGVNKGRQIKMSATTLEQIGFLSATNGQRVQVFPFNAEHFQQFKSDFSIVRQISKIDIDEYVEFPAENTCIDSVIIEIGEHLDYGRSVSLGLFCGNTRGEITYYEVGM